MFKKLKTSAICALLLVTIGLSIGYTTALNYNDDFSDFPEPYCARRDDGCCDNRRDVCAMPISTTLCYCDQFCDRSVNGDCCPDYFTFCLHQAPPNITSCEHKRVYFSPGHTIKDNCNLCKCNMNGVTSCSDDTCLIDEELIDNVNMISDSLGWVAANYSEFWGKKYADGLIYRLGTFEPRHRVKGMTKLSSKIESIPTRFNAVEHWPNLIGEIRDQGWCGSSWAVSTASVASDRFAVQSKGKETVNLAPQQLISCVRKQQGCTGGHLDQAWNYIRGTGLVEENCYAYNASKTHCRVKKRSDTLATLGCKSTTRVKERVQLYKVGPAYSLNNATDIMIEIMNSGPVQALMRVYRDFFTYKEGIYRHSAASRNEKSGTHSVRIVGWGEERSGYETIKYWIAANSWGKYWGENGYFRILRGVNECDIESYVLATWASLSPFADDGNKIKNSNY